MTNAMPSLQMTIKLSYGWRGLGLPFMTSKDRVARYPRVALTSKDRAAHFPRVALTPPA